MLTGLLIWIHPLCYGALNSFDGSTTLAHVDGGTPSSRDGGAVATTSGSTLFSWQCEDLSNMPSVLTNNGATLASGPNTTDLVVALVDHNNAIDCDVDGEYVRLASASHYTRLRTDLHNSLLPIPSPWDLLYPVATSGR